MTEADPFDLPVSLLYETVLDATQWAPALAALARVFDAPMAAQWRFDFQAGSAREFRSHGHDAGVLERYAAHYHQIDPGMAAASRSHLGEWCGDEQLFDRHAPEQQAYAIEFARPSDIGWVGGGRVQGTEPHTGVWFGVQRHFRDRPFGRAGRHTFERLAPHLQRVSRMRERLDHLALGQVLAQASLDTLRSAVFVVDASRCYHLLNRAADQLLCGDAPLSAQHGRVSAALPDEDDELAAAIAGACGTMPRGSAMELTRDGDHLPLQVVLVPVPQQHDMARLRPVPLAMLFVTDPDLPHLAPETYQALFKLTPAEAALMFALVNGSTVTDWAHRRGVTVSTARTQLNAVFAKTGVDSQPRLIRIAKALPSLL
jgi:DNA-binding CsgD family transcriptional regulator